MMKNRIGRGKQVMAGGERWGRMAGVGEKEDTVTDLHSYHTVDLLSPVHFYQLVEM